LLEDRRHQSGTQIVPGVAVISNGTAELRLGNTGASAVKSVMEGKAVLLKKLTGIEANAEDPY
jgi:malic enzyme